MISTRGFNANAFPPRGGAIDGSSATLPPEFLLAGVIGAHLAEPLHVIGKLLDECIRTRGISSAQMQQLRASLARASQIAKQSQQIARLASGRLRQSHERLKLDVILRDALHGRADSFLRHEVEVHQNLNPVEIIVDASLLSSLIEVALDWALNMGQRLVVMLDMKNWPEYGVLLIKTSPSIASHVANDEIVEGENLDWYLLSETAHAMGVSLEKVTSAQEVSLLMEFPRTVRRLEGMTAVELDTGFDSIHSESKPFAGHRVLVITNDEHLRIEVMSIARSMGLVVDFAPTTTQGVRFCEVDAPHMVIIDQKLRDHIFDELRSDLRRTDPNFPFIEISQESNTLEVAGWMSDSMTRLGRDALRSQLPSIMVLELAKVI